jgi:hypothetical protein
MQNTDFGKTHNKLLARGVDISFAIQQNEIVVEYLYKQRSKIGFVSEAFGFSCQKPRT